MDERRHNFDLPAGVSEADVAEVVSPPRLMTADRRAELARIEALLMADARWGELVRSMRAQAAVLSAPSGAAVPSGIAAGIESRLNELALQELLAAERTVEAIPVSRVQYGPSRSWRAVVASLAGSAAGRGVAVAAALALMVGGGWMLMQSVRRAWPDLSRTTVARNGDVHTTYGFVTEGAGEASADAAAQALASADEGVDAERPITLAGPEIEAAGTTEVASAEAPAMTAERALALAAEGRLAIRVTTLQPERMTHRLNGLSRDPSGPWKRLRDDSPRGVAYASLRSSRPIESGTTGDPAREVVRRGAPALAGTGSGSPPVGAPVESGRAVSAFGPRWISVEALYELEIAREPAALDALASALRRQSVQIDGEPGSAGGERGMLPSAGVELVELDAPVGVNEISADPRDVLWWSVPGERWIKRVRVPVVVETVR